MDSQDALQVGDHARAVLVECLPPARPSCPRAPVAPSVRLATRLQRIMLTVTGADPPPAHAPAR